jgi:hypothetical protein
MEIEYSTLHIRSLISSNFNVYASHFETINLIKGSVQTDNLTDVMNPLMMCSPFIYIHFIKVIVCILIFMTGS